MSEGPKGGKEEMREGEVQTRLDTLLYCGCSCFYNTCEYSYNTCMSYTCT